jgi:antagonist of KipI
MLANALVGNSAENSVALEVTLTGPVLRATAFHACAFVGAPFSVRVNGQDVSTASVWYVEANQVVEIGTAAAGVRGYLAVAGGFEGPAILGSRSALRPVRKGEQLPCPSIRIVRRRWLEPLPHAGVFFSPSVALRVLPGPYWPQVAPLLSQRLWEVSQESNRMGVRLQANLAWQLPSDLPSVPVCPGTIQATASGQLLILGVDGPTIGGYPRVGYVIEADWDRLGQLRPGQAVEFVPVTLEQARREASQLRAWQRQTSLRLHLASTLTSAG